MKTIFLLLIGILIVFPTAGCEAEEQQAGDIQEQPSEDYGKKAIEELANAIKRSNRKVDLPEHCDEKIYIELGGHIFALPRDNGPLVDVPRDHCKGVIRGLDTIIHNAHRFFIYKDKPPKSRSFTATVHINYSDHAQPPTDTIDLYSINNIPFPQSYDHLPQKHGFYEYTYSNKYYDDLRAFIPVNSEVRTPKGNPFVLKCGMKKSPVFGKGPAKRMCSAGFTREKIGIRIRHWDDNTIPIDTWADFIPYMLKYINELDVTDEYLAEHPNYELQELPSPQDGENP